MPCIYTLEDGKTQQTPWNWTAGVNAEKCTQKDQKGSFYHFISLRCWVAASCSPLFLEKRTFLQKAAWSYTMHNVQIASQCITLFHSVKQILLMMTWPSRAAIPHHPRWWDHPHRFPEPYIVTIDATHHHRCIDDWRHSSGDGSHDSGDHRREHRRLDHWCHWYWWCHSCYCRCWHCGYSRWSLRRWCHGVRGHGGHRGRHRRNSGDRCHGGDRYGSCHRHHRRHWGLYHYRPYRHWPTSSPQVSFKIQVVSLSHQVANALPQHWGITGIWHCIVVNLFDLGETFPKLLQFFFQLHHFSILFPDLSFQQLNGKLLTFIVAFLGGDLNDTMVSSRHFFFQATHFQVLLSKFKSKLFSFDDRLGSAIPTDEEFNVVWGCLETPGYLGLGGKEKRC